jgi:threonine dehydrogenase-like Zn-dependent dehydrogenase
MASMLSITFEPRAWRWVTAKVFGWAWPHVYWSKLGAVQLRDVERPSLPGKDWVLLHTRLGGICGTDLGMVQLKHHPGSLLRAYLPSQVALGHENVAEIIGLGSAVTGWKIGQRVTADSSLGCSVRGIWPPCPSCAAGLFCLCENFDRGAVRPAVLLGGTDFAGGSWSEFFVAHESQLHAVPEAMDDEEAILIDPVACALHAVLRCWPEPENRVAVLGGGIIALATIACLRAMGFTGAIDALLRSNASADRAWQAGANRVIVMGGSRRAADRLAPVAEGLGQRLVLGKYGNAMIPAGYDLVYDAVGSSQSLSDAGKMTGPRGTIALLGTPQIVLAELTPIWFREQRLVGCYGRQIEQQDGPPRHTYEMVLDLVRTGKLSLSAWRADAYPLVRWADALAAAAGQGGPRRVKTAIDFRTLSADQA